MNRWGLLFLGAGGGLAGGALAGEPALLAGAIVAVVGVGALLLGGRSEGSDLIGGRTEENRPTLEGLPQRVEQILRLAEEQAADMIAEARAEAERLKRQ